MTALSYLPARPDATVPDTGLFVACLLVTALVVLVVVGGMALWERRVAGGGR